MTLEEKLELAQQPLPKELVLKHGKSGCYFYHYQAIVNRLNECFGELGWRYKVDSVMGEKAVKCSLGILGENSIWVEREHISAPLFERPTTPETLKSASLYGIVGCAMLFNIGAELYDSNYIKELDSYYAEKTQEKLALEQKDKQLEDARAQLTELLAEKKISIDGAKEIACTILKLDRKAFDWKNLNYDQIVELGKFINKGKQ